MSQLDEEFEVINELDKCFFEPVSIPVSCYSRQEKKDIRAKFENLDLLETFSVTNFSTESIDHCMYVLRHQESNLYEQIPKNEDFIVAF